MAAMALPSMAYGSETLEQRLIVELNEVDQIGARLTNPKEYWGPKLEQASASTLAVCGGNASLKDAKPNTPCRNQLLRELEIIDEYEGQLRGGIANLLEGWAKIFAMYTVSETYCEAENSSVDAAFDLLITLVSDGHGDADRVVSTYYTSANRALDHIKSGEQINCQIVESLRPRMEQLLADMRVLEAGTTNK